MDRIWAMMVSVPFTGRSFIIECPDKTFATSNFRHHDNRLGGGSAGCGSAEGRPEVYRSRFVRRAELSWRSGGAFGYLGLAERVQYLGGEGQACAGVCGSHEPGRRADGENSWAAKRRYRA